MSISVDCSIAMVGAAVNPTQCLRFSALQWSNPVNSAPPLTCYPRPMPWRPAPRPATEVAQRLERISDDELATETGEAADREGTLDDAMFFAAGANKKHGKRRDSQTKANAVRLLLRTSRGKEMLHNGGKVGGQTAIAKYCGLTEGRVSQVLSESGLNFRAKVADNLQSSPEVGGASDTTSPDSDKTPDRRERGDEDLARALLQENPSRTDKDISKESGCSRAKVASIRKDLGIEPAKRGPKSPPAAPPATPTVEPFKPTAQEWSVLEPFIACTRALRLSDDRLREYFGYAEALLRKANSPASNRSTKTSSSSAKPMRRGMSRASTCNVATWTKAKGRWLGRD